MNSSIPARVSLKPFCLPDGSAEIPLRWGGMLVALGVLAVLVAGIVLLIRGLAGA